MTQGNYPENLDPADPRARGRAYEQSTYGQNAYGDPVNPFGAAGDYAFGIAALVTGLLGGIVLLVSFTAIDWFDGSVAFGDIHDQTQHGVGTGFGKAYFGWLAWVALIVVVAAAVLASFPSPGLRAFRAIGVVVGLAMAGLTFLAIKPDGSASYSDVLGRTQAGFYLAVAGFLLAGIGAGIGARRV